MISSGGKNVHPSNPPIPASASEPPRTFMNERRVRRLSVADITIRQPPGIGNVIFLEQLLRELGTRERIGRSLPIHVENLIERSKLRPRIFMAGQAVIHVEAAGPPRHRHLIDSSVAGHA